jgi:hypothetical protein
MRRVFYRSAFTALTLLLLMSSNAHANAIALYDTVFSTNFVTAAVGLRDVGAGSITVSGVSGTVTRALLYWHGPTNSASPTINANVTVAGTAVSGTNIGLSQDNFWGAQNSQAYRADVTSLITGNGSFSLAGFQNASAFVNGATLFVFYDDGNAANNRDVVLFNGNDSNFSSAFDAAGWNFTLNGINYTSGTANLVTYVSDGQNFGALDDGTLRVNGSFLATGGMFQGLAPKAPGAGVANGSLTDISTFNLTPFLVPGLNNLNMTLDEGFNDALSAVVAAVDLPAGAAPPPPPSNVPEPATLVLVGAGLALVARRRLLTKS